MEFSSSKNPADSISEGNSNGDKGLEDEAIISFGSLELSNNGTLMSQNKHPQKFSACQSSMKTKCCSSRGIEIDEFPASLEIECPLRKTPSGDTQKLAVPRVSMLEKCSSQGTELDKLPEILDVEWPSTSLYRQGHIWKQSLYRQGDIWKQPNINYIRGMPLAQNNHSGQESNPVSSSAIYTDNELNHVAANLYRIPGGQTYANSIHEYPPIQSPVASSWNNPSDLYHSGNCKMNGFDGNSNSMMGSQFSYNELRQIRNCGYFLKNNIGNSTQSVCQGVMQQNSSLQQGSCILRIARTHDGSRLLQKYLQLGDYKLTKRILDDLLDSILHLMIDDYGNHVLGVLVEKCDTVLLWPIINKAYSEPDTFICVAFKENGSRLIQRLIKRIKKTRMSEVVTSILSTRSYELLTHKTGSHVIRQCFISLGEEPNLVLYEAMSNYLLELATDPVGCISLNICINCITGTSRIEFLEYLAAHSRFLSSDPSGNFVVQHMLNLHNVSITEKILNQLKGNIEQLAQKQGGSHVVERCILSSPRGLELVIKEIMKDGKTLYQLAKDMFGNYVIQTALKEAKVNDPSLYQTLVEALRPYSQHLMLHSMGRHVTAVM